MKKTLIFLILIPCYSFSQLNITNTFTSNKKSFVIADQNKATSIYYDDTENALIKKSAELLAGDIEKVCGMKPAIVHAVTSEDRVIIIGTISNNLLIRKLIARNKINMDSIQGKWERFLIQTVDNPFPNVKQALVIIGSDRRGTAYGVFTLSEEMGISPWYWWADVPIEKHNEIYIQKCKYISNSASGKNKYYAERGLCWYWLGQSPED